MTDIFITCGLHFAFISWATKLSWKEINYKFLMKKNVDIVEYLGSLDFLHISKSNILQDVLHAKAYENEHLRLVNVPLPLKHLMWRDTYIKLYTCEQFKNVTFLLHIIFGSLFSILFDSFW